MVPGEHDALVREALALARSARDRGNHPFGALLAVGGRILLRAENSVVTDGDPSRHAELNLLQLAWARLGREEIEAATLYSSTEPCPMCTGAIYYSRVSRVVYSLSQAQLSRITGGRFALPCTDLLDRADREVEVVGPVLPQEGRLVHEGFWPEAAEFRLK
jgi:tRNA(Arg) A34 adenosine deaminase TadA